MKRIIALFGHANCGKTATLNYLREMIRTNGGISLSSEPHTGDQPETFKYKDMIVCICPGGDDYYAIERNLSYSETKNADIVITASRCRGDGPALIESTAKAHNFKTEWKQKSYETELCAQTQDACNREYAKILFDML